MQKIALYDIICGMSQSEDKPHPEAISQEKLELAQNAIKNFAVALLNIRLYPPESQQIIKSILQTHELITQAVEACGRLILGEWEGTVLINGHLLPKKKHEKIDTGPLLKNMTDSGIKSITFKPGLKREELVAFLEGLNKKVWKIQEGRPPLELLKEKGVEHIAVHEKIYVALGESPLAIEKGLTSGSGFDIDIDKHLSAQAEKLKNDLLEEPSPEKTKNLIAEQGLSELIPSWPTTDSSEAEEKKMPPLVLAESLLAQEILPLASAQVQTEVANMVREFNVSGQTDLRDKIVSKLVKGFSSTTAENRAGAAECFKELSPALEGVGCLEALETAREETLKTIKQETDAAAYSQFSQLLEETAASALRERNYQAINDVVTCLRGQADSPDKNFPEKQRLAQESLNRMADSDIGKMLTEDLASPEPDIKKQARAVVFSLGDPMTACLIEALKEAPDLRTQKNLSLLIKEIGEKAVSLLAKTINQAPTAELSIKIIALMPGLDNEKDIVEELKQALLNSHHRVRYEAIRALGQIGGTEAARTITEALDDENPLIRRQAVKILGKMRYPAAVPVLIQMLQARNKLKTEEKTSIGEEICQALSQIKDPRCIDPLIKLANPPAWALWFKTAASRELRIAAIKTLGSFRDPRVKNLLIALTNTKDKFVRLRAGQTLENLKKSLRDT